MITTVFEILFAALILFGVWHREKLIAFEDEIETMAARKAAEIVRRAKNGGIKTLPVLWE